MYKKLLLNNIVILLLISFIFSSCKKTRLNKDKEILVGNWEWKYSIVRNHSFTGYVYYDTLYPGVQEGTASLEFKKSGKIKIFRDDDLIEERKVYISVWTFEEAGYFYNIYLDSRKSEIDNVITGFVKNNELTTSQYFPYKNVTQGKNTKNYTNYFVRK